ncbi:RHS repeat-associated core domain-containing protein [Microbulbifer sp. ANSA001]|uniref:RHS repeat-associated core domain-containing protein n=1 Tax=Microbulbifer sp. ANSA001 TaxID=3243358 RepID=UPI0040419378
MPSSLNCSSSLLAPAGPHPVTHRTTGHEILDQVGLIHMNGRVYDPTLARFVSADPLIDGVISVQGYNRYAYVHNNPLTYTDPSGYSSWNKYRDSVVKPVVAVAIAIWTGGQSLVALQATNYAAAVGWAAAGGAAAGAVQSGTVKGAFFGAFSAVAFMGIGNAFQGATWATKGVVGKGIMGTGLNGYGYAAKVFAHSVTGGLLSAAQGGKFKHGFAAAGVTQAFAGGIDSIDAGNVGFSAARVIAAAIVGGTASAVSGGKFANGAATAAFAMAMSSLGQRGTPEGAPNQESIDRVNAIPDSLEERQAIYAEGLEAAQNVDAANIDADLETIMLGRRSGNGWDYQGFSTKSDAIAFLEANSSWGIVDGIHFGGNSIGIYAGATASGTTLRSGSMLKAYLLSGRTFSTNMTGVENVIQTLAHETGHAAGISHGNAMLNREFKAIRQYRRGF